MKTGWTVGHLTVDDIIHANGITHFGSIGGDAIYSAIGAILSGSSPFGICSRLAHDYPSSAIRELESYGIPLKLTKCEANGRFLWILYEKNGTRTVIPHQGAGSHEELAPRPMEAPDWKNVSAIHIAAMPVDFQRLWVLAASELGLTISLDPHWDSCEFDAKEVWDLLPKITAFLPSELEAEYLFGKDMESAALAFVTAGAQIAVVKIGEQGSIIAFKENMWYVPAFQTEVVDTTGAGDVFCGGFLATLHKEKNPLLACLYATAVASLKIEHCGVLDVMKFADIKEVEERVNYLQPLCQQLK